MIRDKFIIMAYDDSYDDVELYWHLDPRPFWFTEETWYLFQNDIYRDQWIQWVSTRKVEGGN